MCFDLHFCFWYKIILIEIISISLSIKEKENTSAHFGKLNVKAQCKSSMRMLSERS
jgi:hypothetical protein